MKKGLSIVIALSCVLLFSRVFTDPKDFTDSLIKVTPIVPSDEINIDLVVDSPPDSSISASNESGQLNIRQGLSPNYFAVIERINVKDMELRDILRGLSYQYNLNLAVDNSLVQLVTISLNNISVIDCIEYICIEHNLDARRIGPVIRLSASPIDIQTSPPKNDMYLSVHNDTLSVDIRNKDIAEVVRQLTILSGKNIVIPSGVIGSVSSFINDVPFETGLGIIMDTVYKDKGLGGMSLAAGYSSVNRCQAAFLHQPAYRLYRFTCYLSHPC